MKFSRFNVLLPSVCDVDIIYNSLSDKFIFIRNGLLSDVITKMDAHLSCWDNLKAGGFIVPNELDELQLYRDREIKIENDNEIAHLIINPTIDCNFRCWYCYEDHDSSKMPRNVMNNIFRMIDNVSNSSKGIVVSFFGGEPLLYYKDVMIPIIDYAFNKCKQKGLNFNANCTTNGSLFTKQRISELKQLNFNSAQITLDGSETIHDKTRCFANGRGSYNAIVNNIKELASNHIAITLRVNYTQENIKSICDIPRSFDDLCDEAKKNITVSFHKVWQEGNVSQEDVDAAICAFVQSGFNASRQLLGQHCYADLRRSVVINYNGDVYKCTAVNFEKTKRDGYLNQDGVIVWENDALEKRMSSKFTNEPCLECSIFPICHGGCSSRSLNEDNYCILGFDENRKKKAVMDKLMYNIRNIWNN